MLASLNGHVEVAKLLLDWDVRIDLQANEGWSALMLASKNGHAEVAKLLLDRDAKIDLQTNDGMSALILASWNGHTEVAILLLDMGAQIDMQAHDDHQSALMYAVETGDLEMVRLLLAFGASTQLRNSNGKTIFDIMFSGDEVQFTV